MNQRVVVVVCLLALGFAAPTVAQSERQERHRVPADYMSFRGAEWLERDDRVSEERPDLVLDAMQLNAGDVVGSVTAPFD